MTLHTRYLDYTGFYIIYGMTLQARKKFFTVLSFDIKKGIVYIVFTINDNVSSID